LRIDRGTNIIWVDKGNEVTPEIQDVLERWSFLKGEPME